MLGQRILDRSRKKLALRRYPTEREWARGQPIDWQDACMVFAIAANTRGGVVGNSMAAMVAEANASGVPISLRTFKRQVKHLQAHGVVWQDRKNPVRTERGPRGQASTWFIRPAKRMPHDARIGDALPEPPSGQTRYQQWLNAHPDTSAAIGRMNARIQAQSPLSPF